MIGESGVQNKITGPSVIPWDSIRRIYFYKKWTIYNPIPSYWICIEVDDYEKFFRPDTISARILQPIQKAVTGDKFFLPLPLIESNERDVSRAIDQYLPKEQNHERYVNWENRKPKELYL